MNESKIGPWASVSDALDALDEPARPSAPPLKGVTPEERAAGRRLAAIHRMHLRDIHAARRLLSQIEAGQETPNALAQSVPQMEMSKNYRDFGNLCGRECMVLNGHHNIEEQHMFPALEDVGIKGLTAVVAKLRAEHEVVHALLEQLYEAAVALVTDLSEEAFEHARKLFAQLEAVVKSHFGYEETELEEALGVYVEV